MIENIGYLIKQIRKKKQLTLHELAKRSGFSVSYLSMLERDLSSPTLASMQSVCAALNITVIDLLSRLEYSKNLVKTDERVLLFEEPDSVKIEALTDGNRNIKAICLSVMDAEVHASGKHISDEFGFILQGAMLMSVEGVDYTLNKGDSLYIPQESEHKFYKTSEEFCVSIWIYHNNSSFMPTLATYKKVEI